MYSIAERTKLSKQIAQVSQIETYRSMLRGYGSKRAGRIILDQQLLAESLVYELLGKCTAEEILERTSNTRQSALHQPVNTAIVAVKKKASKYEEYPSIRWKDLENPLIQTADLIYSDRINCHQRLRELESTLGETSDWNTLAEYIGKAIRMELCFEELKAFDRTGKFLGKHPFIACRSERERVAELLRSDPDKWFEERKNIELNITRYTSQISSDRFSEEKKKKFAELLEQHQASLAIYKEIFNEFIKK